MKTALILHIQCHINMHSCTLNYMIPHKLPFKNQAMSIVKAQNIGEKHSSQAKYVHVLILRLTMQQAGRLIQCTYIKSSPDEAGLMSLLKTETG